MSPHHFQQLDTYHEHLLASRLEGLTPYAWGIVEMQVSGASLAAGQFEIQEFAGILPDGTPLSFRQGGVEAPVARPVEPNFPPTQATVEVYLAIPKERDGVANFGETSAEGARFVTDERTISDNTAVAAPAQVAFARRNTQLLFVDESREDCDYIQVAELVRDSQGGLALCEPFVPPCLRIGASHFIMVGLRRALGLMVAKQRDLAEMRRAPGQGNIQFAATDVTEYLQLNTLNTYIPVLSHMIESADMSPREVYLTLIQLAGQLGTFATDSVPAELPSFNYTALRLTFEPLFARLTGLMHTAVRERFWPVNLEQREDGVLIADLTDERFLSSVMVLSVRCDQPDQTVGAQVPRLAKLSTGTQIHAMVRSAMPGVPLRLTHRPPSEIPVQPGVVYFLVETTDPYWQSVLAERSLAIYLAPPYDPSRAQVSLMAVPHSA